MSDTESDGPVTRSDITGEFMRRAVCKTVYDDARDNVVALLNLAIECGIVSYRDKLSRQFGVLEQLARSGFINPQLIGTAVAYHMAKKFDADTTNGPANGPSSKGGHHE